MNTVSKQSAAANSTETTGKKVAARATKRKQADLAAQKNGASVAAPSFAVCAKQTAYERSIETGDLNEFRQLMQGGDVHVASKLAVRAACKQEENYFLERIMGRMTAGEFRSVVQTPLSPESAKKKRRLAEETSGRGRTDDAPQRAAKSAQAGNTVGDTVSSTTSQAGEEPVALDSVCVDIKNKFGVILDTWPFRPNTVSWHKSLSETTNSGHWAALFKTAVAFASLPTYDTDKVIETITALGITTQVPLNKKPRTFCQDVLFESVERAAAESLGDRYRPNKVINARQTARRVLVRLAWLCTMQFHMNDSSTKTFMQLAGDHEIVLPKASYFKGNVKEFMLDIKHLLNEKMLSGSNARIETITMPAA